MRVCGVAIVLVSLLSAGCGTELGSSSIVLEGTVWSDHRVDLPCDEQADLPTRPEELSGILLAFSDGEGRPLGQATTGPLEWDQLDYGCRFYARYEVSLPRADRYRVEFQPPPPREIRGAYFEGAELLEPASASLAELEAAGLQWSFEASPAYVTP